LLTSHLIRRECSNCRRRSAGEPDLSRGVAGAEFIISFANVASNWLSWTLKGDKKAGQMFVGKNCSLCTNSNWDVRSKGIK
jgi:hypothetical protein